MDEETKQTRETDGREHLHEIKQFLYGNFKVGADKRLTATRTLLGNPWGFADGAPEVFLFGVMRREYVYDSTKQVRARTHYETSKMLGKLGRSLRLETAPDHAACLMRHMFFRPVVLELGEQLSDDGGRETVLYAYSGRTLFSLLSLVRAVSVFEKHMPGQMYRVEKKKEKPRPDPKEAEETGNETGQT